MPSVLPGSFANDLNMNQNQMVILYLLYTVNYILCLLRFLILMTAVGHELVA